MAHCPCEMQHQCADEKGREEFGARVIRPRRGRFFHRLGQSMRAVPDADHDRHHLRQCLCCENIPCDVNNKCGQVHRLKLDRARRGLNFITLGVNIVTAAPLMLSPTDTMICLPVSSSSTHPWPGMICLMRKPSITSEDWRGLT